MNKQKPTVNLTSPTMPMSTHRKSQPGNGKRLTGSKSYLGSGMSVFLMGLLGTFVSQAEPVSLTSDKWDTRNTEFNVADRNGKEALVLSGKFALASVKGMDFHDGTIEVDMMAPKGGPMFFGVAFRIQDEEDRSITVSDNDTLKYEYIYFRPFCSDTENAIQYCAAGTKFSWEYLRKNHPGVYEAGASVPLTDWFHVKIDVEGTTAKVYVNRADEPSLVINDLKHGNSRGSVGVYSFWETAYFANFEVKPRKQDSP